jgi:chromosome segregation ATPase
MSEDGETGRGIIDYDNEYETKPIIKGLEKEIAALNELLKESEKQRGIETGKLVGRVEQRGKEIAALTQENVKASVMIGEMNKQITKLRSEKEGLERDLDVANDWIAKNREAYQKAYQKTDKYKAYKKAYYLRKKPASKRGGGG